MFIQSQGLSNHLTDAFKKEMTSENYAKIIEVLNSDYIYCAYNNEPKSDPYYFYRINNQINYQYLIGTTDIWYGNDIMLAVYIINYYKQNKTLENSEIIIILMNEYLKFRKYTKIPNTTGFMEKNKLYASNFFIKTVNCEIKWDDDKKNINININIKNTENLSEWYKLYIFAIDIYGPEFIKFMRPKSPLTKLTINYKNSQNTEYINMSMDSSYNTTKEMIYIKSLLDVYNNCTFSFDTKQHLDKHKHCSLIDCKCTNESIHLSENCVIDMYVKTQFQTSSGFADVNYTVYLDFIKRRIPYLIYNHETYQYTLSKIGEYPSIRVHANEERNSSENQYSILDILIFIYTYIQKYILSRYVNELVICCTKKIKYNMNTNIYIYEYGTLYYVLKNANPEIFNNIVDVVFTDTKPSEYAMLYSGNCYRIINLYLRRINSNTTFTLDTHKILLNEHDIKKVNKSTITILWGLLNKYKIYYVGTEYNYQLNKTKFADSKCIILNHVNKLIKIDDTIYMLIKIHNNQGYIYKETININITEQTFKWSKGTGQIIDHEITMKFTNIDGKQYPVRNNKIYKDNQSMPINITECYDKTIVLKLLCGDIFGSRVLEDESNIFKFDDGEYLGSYKIFSDGFEYEVKSSESTPKPVIEYFNEFSRDFVKKFDTDFHPNENKIMTFRLGMFKDDFVNVDSNTYKTACYISSSYIKENTNSIPYVSELSHPELIICIINPGVLICEVYNNSIADESEILIKHGVIAKHHQTYKLEYFKNTPISIWPIDDIQVSADNTTKYNKFIQSIMLSSYYNHVVNVHIVELCES